MKVVVLISLFVGCMASEGVAQTPLPMTEDASLTIDTPARGVPNLFKETFSITLGTRDRLRLKSSCVGKSEIFASIKEPGGKQIGNPTGNGSYDWTSEPVGVTGRYIVELWAAQPLDIKLTATVVSRIPPPLSPEQEIVKLREQIKALEKRLEKLEQRALENERRR